jgi:hypothetical protein
MTTMIDTIKLARQLWRDDFTHEQIKVACSLSDEQEYAIIECGNGKPAEALAAALAELKLGMTAEDIKAIIDKIPML